MSRRPPRATIADTRPVGLSRRSILAAAASAPLPLALNSAIAADEALIASELWLTQNAEHERLARCWSRLEAKLAREHDWLRLSRRQQRRLPQGRELFELDVQLDRLHDENAKLLLRLPTIAASTDAGLAAKLAVAVLEVRPEENEEAHFLIASVLRDLKLLHPRAA